jgi:hypothetical protein
VVRRIAAMVAILVATATLVPAPVAAAAAEAQLAVPTTIPAGWYVLGARPPQPPAPADGYRYYARDLADGPALAVGTTSCDGGCDELNGHSTRVRGPRDSPGTLVRRGKHVWVTWTEPDAGQDLANVVIGRDISDREALAAARATDRDARGIARGGRPEGFRDRGFSHLGPRAIPYGVEKVTLLGAERGRTVELYISEPDPVARAEQAFFAAQHPYVSGSTPIPRLVTVRVGPRLIVVSGDMPARDMKTIARSVRPTDAAGWDHFRARVADIPVTALLPGLAGVGSYTQISGSTPTVRWAAAFTSDATGATAYTALADADAGMIAGAGFRRAYEGDRVLTLTASQADGVQLVTGVVPAGTASVRFEGTGTPPIAVAPSDQSPGGGRRYYAVLLPVRNVVVATVALDANGIEIARS